jgi:hypothetical protein
VGIEARIESNLWITWVQIGCERERTATEARSRVAASDSGDPEYAEAIVDEMHGAMVAVSAASHALDAFYGKVHQVGGLPPAAASWDKNATPRWSRILETLKHNFQIGKHTGRWAIEFEWLFDLRDAAVHHTSKARPTVPHPSGKSHVSQEIQDFSVEAANRALDLAIEVMAVCLVSPRPERPEVKTWTASASHVPRMLKAFRS